MRLLDYISENAFLPGQECRDLEAAVQRLVATLVVDGDVADADSLVVEILRREEEGSTTLEGGLAIPHARHEMVQHLRLAVTTLTHPFAGAEGDPVDVVILIVGPRGDPRQMLRILARLARVVKHGEFLGQLRAAGTPAAMRQVFVAAEATQV